MHLSLHLSSCLILYSLLVIVLGNVFVSVTLEYTWQLVPLHLNDPTKPPKSCSLALTR